jgi:hypothetical protein
MSCPEKTAETFENIESGPGNDTTRTGSKPPDAMPGLCGPLGVNPAAPGFHRQHVRMVLNGVAAC